MMRAILIGAALAASALPAAAYELRQYGMQADQTDTRPGLEYIVVGRDGRKVRVVEGQPRWNRQNYETMRQPREIYGAVSDGLRSVFE